MKQFICDICEEEIKENEEGIFQISFSRSKRKQADNPNIIPSQIKIIPHVCQKCNLSVVEAIEVMNRQWKQSKSEMA